MEFEWLTLPLAVSVLTILKNPMILMGGVSMLLFIGMPYLMDNSMYNLPLNDHHPHHILAYACLLTSALQWTPS